MFSRLRSYYLHDDDDDDDEDEAGDSTYINSLSPSMVAIFFLPSPPATSQL